MAWIAQQYEGDVHVIPDTEEGHVLSSTCFCEPRFVDGNEDGNIVWTHREMRSDGESHEGKEESSSGS